MNPESGWEKENVENKVGYLRRNELVPVPRFNDLAEENRHLLERCESDMQREHYDDDDNRFISELFEEDKARLRSFKWYSATKRSRIEPDVSSSMGPSPVRSQTSDTPNSRQMD